MLNLGQLPNKLGVDISVLKKALKDRGKEIISNKEFMSIVLSWSYHKVFKEGYYEHAEEPIKPPHIVRYDKLPFEERKDASSDFKDRIKADRLAWLDEKGKIKNENDSNYAWLARMKAYYKYLKSYTIEREINDRMLIFTISRIR